VNHHTNIVREVQFLTWQRAPNTGLIVTYDTNVGQGIHPICKMPVGERSARRALSTVYGVKRRGSDQPLEWRGQMRKEAEEQMQQRKLKEAKLLLKRLEAEAAGKK